MVNTLYCTLLLRGLRVPHRLHRHTVVCQLILGVLQWSVCHGEHPQTPPNWLLHIQKSKKSQNKTEIMTEFVENKCLLICNKNKMNLQWLKDCRVATKNCFEWVCTVGTKSISCGGECTRSGGKALMEQPCCSQIPTNASAFCYF